MKILLFIKNKLYALLYITFYILYIAMLPFSVANREPFHPLNSYISGNLKCSVAGLQLITTVNTVYNKIYLGYNVLKCLDPNEILYGIPQK